MPDHSSASCRPFPQNLTGFFQKKSKLTALVYVLLFLACIPGILSVQKNNSPKIFLPPEHSPLLQPEELSPFATFQIILISVTGNRMWSRPGLAWLQKTEGQLLGLPGVYAVIGLHTLWHWKTPFWPPRDPLNFKKQVARSASPLIRGLISRDMRTVNIPVFFKTVSDRETDKLLHSIERITSEPLENTDIRLSGIPVIRRAMDRSLDRSALPFFFILVVLCAAAVKAVFGRYAIFFAVMLFVAIFCTIFFGIIGYCGITINLVNIILAPILFVIALASIVHVLMHLLLGNRQKSLKSSMIEESFCSKTRPLIWTGVTTLVAFGSLGFAANRAIRNTGFLAAAGILLLFFMLFSLLPALLEILKHKLTIPASRGIIARMSRAGNRAARTGTQKTRLLLISALAVAGLALFGITRTSTEDNFVTYFSPGHPLRQHIESLESRRMGVFYGDIMIAPAHGNDPGFNMDICPANLKKLTEFSRQLRTLPLLRGAVSAGDLLEHTIQAILVKGKVTDSLRWLGLGLLEREEKNRQLLFNLMNPKKKSARIFVLLPVLKARHIQILKQAISEKGQSVFADSRVSLAGIYLQLLQGQQHLLAALISSFLTTFVCVGFMFALILRKTSLTLKALAVNLWPLLLVMGLMGLLNLPLDSATVMTVAVVLGLAVDDTFHTLGYFREYKKNQPPAAAIVNTLTRTAPAHIFTSLTMAAGFSICAFSELQPVARMGAVAAAGILLALLADLLIVPALLAREKN